MTAINHALTGALIGLLVQNPVVALPLALGSHFMCDALPHFGMGRLSIASHKFTIFLRLDITLCILLVSILAIFQPYYWFLACATAFVATSPDFMWLPRYLHARKGKEINWQKDTGIVRLHAYIQWFERPVGAVVEIAWLVGAVSMLTVIVI